MLRRNSEDEMCSRFVLELVIWPQKVTLARWTQPSGPLCLWQCLPWLLPFLAAFDEGFVLCSWFSSQIHFLDICLVYGASWGVLTMTDNESTAGWFIKLFMRWSRHVNLKSCGNKILFFVASFSRNHYCTTAGWDCLELNLMRFVRIDVCKIQFQLFWNSNSILNGFSGIPKH